MASQCLEAILSTHLVQSCHLLSSPKTLQDTSNIWGLADSISTDLLGPKSAKPAKRNWGPTLLVWSSSASARGMNLWWRHLPLGVLVDICMHVYRFAFILLVCMHAAYDFYLCIKYFIHMTIFIFYACLDRLCLKFKWTSAFANKDQKKVHRGGWNSSVANALPRTLWISMCPWLRKDKYNSDINKYHVEIDEEDESVDEDLERYVKTSTKVSPCVSVCVLILVHFTVVPCLLFENICGCSARNSNINQRVHLYFCVLCTCRCIYCMSDLSYHARPTILPTIYTVSKTQNVNMNGSYLYI